MRRSLFSSLFVASRTGGRARVLLLLLLLLRFANSPAQAAGDLEPVRHASRSLPRVALTFDLCQKPDHPAGFDLTLIALLETERVAATFFAGGDWMRTHPEETRRLAANPRFELGNHSWSHPDFRQLSPGQIEEELRRTDDLLRQLTGRRSQLMRLPYGYYSAATLDVLTRLGWTAIQWDVVTGDPDPAVSAAAMAATVQREVRNGSIVIMHANGRGRHTAEALPQILAGLKARGFELVTISELLQER